MSYENKLIDDILSDRPPVFSKENDFKEFLCNVELIKEVFSLKNISKSKKNKLLNKLASMSIEDLESVRKGTIIEAYNEFRNEINDVNDISFPIADERADEDKVLGSLAGCAIALGTALTLGTSISQIIGPATAIGHAVLTVGVLAAASCLFKPLKNINLKLSSIKHGRHGQKSLKLNEITKQIIENKELEQ